jgi:hypothetical protein
LDITTQVVALYGAVAMVMVGLLYPYALPHRRELLRLTSEFRPLFLGFLLAHCVFTLISPFTSPAFLPLASVSIVGAILMLALEARSDHKSVPRKWLWVALSLVSLLAVFAEFRSDFGAAHDGPPVIFAFIVQALLIWVSVEVFINLQMRQSRHLLLVFILSLLGVAVITMRVWLTNFGESSVIDGTYRESFPLFVSRIGFPVLLCLVSIALNNYYMERMWRREAISRVDAENNLLETLNSLARVRDEETGNHIVRTRNYVRVLAERLAKAGQLNVIDRPDFINILYQVAPLHDIGKVGIPDHILLKPGRLDAGEWEIMKTHAQIGESVLGAAAVSAGGGGPREESEFRRNLMRTAQEIAGGHHENWDGSGYPRGLEGEEIPVSARLMSLADTYDALISKRPYKEPWEHEEAVAEILRLEGKKFDPQVVAAFLAEQGTFRQIAVRYRD